jgi:hypothetical protein
MHGNRSRMMLIPGAGADPVKGHGCTHVQPIIFAKTSKLGACQIAK